MNFSAVLVSFTLDDQNIYETSGVLFNTNMVLLTGTAFLQLQQQEKWISQFLNSCSSEIQFNSYIENVHFRVHIESRSDNENQDGSTGLYSCEGKAVGVWKCPLVCQSTRKLFSEWTVGDFENKSMNDVDPSKELMSVFILLKCNKRGEDSKQSHKATSNDVTRALIILLSNLENGNRGQEVEVLSTPFGNKHFINSLSRGVISNAVGCEKCIILSDARTVSGCEGGPIFMAKGSRKIRERGRLIGIVTCPLTWWRGERVGFTVGISLLPVVKKLLHLKISITPTIRITSDDLSSGAGMNYNITRSKEHLPNPTGNLIRFRDSSLFKFVDENVVLIRSKDSWGSGVVLQGVSGIVLTCSHVVKNDEVISVFQMKQQWLADVVFRSRNDFAYDLAVIKIRISCGRLKEVKFAEKPAKLGETVMAAGFPFFSEQDDIHIRPSIVTGCISRVNPYMIQTTCCIQSGFSGGPLFRDGKLLGIIVSNTIGSGVLYPHINFIIPSSVFKDQVLEYIRTNDVRSLKDLESPNTHVQSMWNSKL